MNGTMTSSKRASSNRSHPPERSPASRTPHALAAARAAGATHTGGPRHSVLPVAPNQRLLGQGEFWWTKLERHSDRWGAFYLEVPGDERPPYDDDALETLVGRRVRLLAEIIACTPMPLRQFAVPGDLLGGRVGDVVELGVGVLRIEELEPWVGVPQNRVLALQTGRRRYRWMRSEAFWYLRAHTVAIRAEPTTEAFAPSFAEATLRGEVLTVVRRGRKVERPTMISEAQFRRLRARLPVR